MSRGGSGAYVFDSILNFRDVGETINQFTGKRLLAEGLLFRSARLDDASASDREALIHEFRIKVIMDLRTKSEHVKQAKKCEEDLKFPALVQSDNTLTQAVEIPGLQYLKININGRGFQRALLWKLSFWNILKVLILMLFGYRMEAISILGREVMKPRGLIGLGYDTIDYCGPEIAIALRALASRINYPILLHCTQGKDRTGLLIALLLFLLDIPLDAINYDYTSSETELLPERELRMVEIREIGLTEEFAGTPKDWIEKLYGYLEERYGGVAAYLDGIGIGKDVQERIIEVLQG